MSNDWTGYLRIEEHGMPKSLRLKPLQMRLSIWANISQW